MVLDYGLHFVERGGSIEAEFFLSRLLSYQHWQLEGLALLLHRQGKGGLPTQDLNDCLHMAILGSYSAYPDELREALILLIREGADVLARDHCGLSVSDIACNPEVKWSDGSMLDRNWYRLRGNHNLRLREIWTEALIECGYDAKEVISTSMRMEELSGSDNESTSDQHEESDPAESDRSEGDIDNPICLMSETCGPECQRLDDDMFWQTHATLPNQYERSLLEGDAYVWRS